MTNEEVVNHNWKFTPTKDGGELRVVTPYETNIVRITADRLQEMVKEATQENMRQTAAEARAARAKGDEARWYGQRDDNDRGR